MKKILTALVLFVAAFCVSASAAVIPDWVDDMQPGDMYTSGEYETSMGFAEEEFTPTDFGSFFTFGNEEVGGAIEQDLSTDVTGFVIGDVDRQVMGQSGSAYVATSDEGFEWDPETPNQAVTAQIGITKDQFAAFSGALVGEPDIVPVTTKDINKDGYDEDIYGGLHDVTYLTNNGVDPSWTATFSDNANAGSLVSGSPVVLYQEMDPSTVTVSTTTFDNNEVFQITGDTVQNECVGLGEIWKGYTDASLQDPWDNEVLLATDTITVGQPDIDALMSYATFDPDVLSQLTEVGATSHSDVTLTQTMYNIGTEPFVVNSMDGSATLGGAFEDAFTGGLPVTISMDSNGFDFWWEEGII